ncbi:type I secretion system membrane fusion protein LapC [Vibrio maritimus]|uniref:Type I secretion system membrane fusion protein LapC n=1 Tax=Vibrio maritimus TaxID=990268 RepID=A0A090RZM8_9VIBR|nr:type I secretion system membrane fusion protein LapC [Vibrio maritimus]
MIQNLEGGLVKEILVREGDSVTQGQQLLLIDDTRFRSDFREREQQVLNLTASVLQLSASLTSVIIDESKSGNDWRESVTLDTTKLAYPPTFEENNKSLVSRQRQNTAKISMNSATRSPLLTSRSGRSNKILSKCKPEFET